MSRPIEPGFVRLYRGETSAFGQLPPANAVPEWVRENPDYQATLKATGRWFSASIEEARYYSHHFGTGGLITFVDVPAADVEQYRASNQPAGEWSAGGRNGPLAQREFYVSREMADRRQLLNQTQLEWNWDGAPSTDEVTAFWRLKNRNGQSIDEPFRPDLAFLARIHDMGPLDFDQTSSERGRQLRKLARLWIDRTIAAEPVLRVLNRAVDEWDTEKQYFPEMVLGKFAEMRLSPADVRRIAQVPASEMRRLFRRAPEPAAIDDIATMNANADALVRASSRSRTPAVA